MSKEKANPITWTLKDIPLDQIKEFDKNPRKLTAKARADLKKSLDKFGLIDKLIINTDFTLIGGHQRFHILAESLPSVLPCWVPNRCLNAKELDELNIRLNKNNGEWDFDMLANEWEQNNLLEWGFTEADFGISEEIEAKEFDESITDGLDLNVRFIISIPNEDATSLHNQLDQILKGFPRAKMEKKI